MSQCPWPAETIWAPTSLSSCPAPKHMSKSYDGLFLAKKAFIFGHTLKSLPQHSQRSVLLEVNIRASCTLC